MSIGVELGSSKDSLVSNITLYRNGKVDLLLGSMLLKLPILAKNIPNKNCRELNFLQKTHWALMAIYPRSGSRARVLQRLPYFKYYGASTLCHAAECNTLQLCRVAKVARHVPPM